MQTYIRPETRVVVIPGGGTTSEPVHIGHYVRLGIVIPDTMTGTKLTFEGAADVAGPFEEIQDEQDNAIEVSATTAAAIGLTGAARDAVLAWPWIRLVSDATEAADRAIVLSLK